MWNRRKWEDRVSVMSHHTHYIILASLVTAWCALHSAMISVSAKEYFTKRLGRTYRYYRLLYNGIAILTLAPVVVFAHSIRTQPFFSWDGYPRIVQIALLGTAALLFFLGARHYDALQFLGLRQMREGTSDKVITESGKLDTSGILGIVRHPWYVAAMLLIWAGNIDVSALIVNAIFTVYLIIGTLLEERKLIREFGDEYRAYQKRVPMYLPWKWLKSKKKAS